EPGNPSGVLLQGWLRSRLGVDVTYDETSGPGITDVSIAGTRRGGTSYDVRIARPDGRTATLSRTGEPDRQLPLARRDVGDLLVDAQAARGSASVVLTGGGIGGASLRELAATPARDAIDWESLDVWWGDERFLPSGHSERNESQARAALLEHVDVDPERIHPMG